MLLSHHVLSERKKECSDSLTIASPSIIEIQKHIFYAATCFLENSIICQEE